MRIRSFFTALAIGVLALTNLYVYANGKILQKEYDEYRDGIFARSYESAIADLGSYLQSRDGEIASRLTARLSELPLSEEELEAVRLLSRDMTAGKEDAEAEKRALTYSEELLRYLSGTRTHSYRESWRASGMGIPSYPKESLLVSASPEEEDAASLRKEKANRLLNTKSTVSYTRHEGDVKVYGYRTATAFVELTEEGNLLRFLRASPHEQTIPDGAAETARRFLNDHGMEGAVFLFEKTEDNTVLFTFSIGDTEVLLGVCHTGVFLFQRKGSGD